MPVYVFSYHTKLSWMPDHRRGYVDRRQGVLPPNSRAAERYWRSAVHDAFELSDDLQRAVIDEIIVACEYQQLKTHFVATEPTHVHVLVGWRTGKTWQSARTGLKTSLTKMLRRLHGPDAAARQFFSNGSSRKHIRNQAHFDHWIRNYGPKHLGWKWSDERGFFK
jgi:hypothetical protein